MIRTFLYKELSHHRTVLIILGIFLSLAETLVMIRVSMNPNSGSSLEALRGFLMVFIPLTMYIVTDRLVRYEYAGKTQMFLESLPISRLQVVVVKFSFGLMLTILLTSLAVSSIVWFARTSEMLTYRFVIILLTRAFAWSFFIYSFFFMFGFLGKYRFTLILLLFIGFSIVEGMTAFEMRQFGPFVLVNDQFSFEREILPKQALVVTTLVSVAFISVAFVMALVREGSVSSMLAEKMSHREKIFIAAAFFSFITMITLLDEKRQKKPFDLPDAITKSRNNITVKISAYDKSAELEKELADNVLNELVALSKFLQINDIAPVFITQRHDLDGFRFERATLEEAEGILVRVNYLDPEWNIQKFVSWLVEQVILEKSSQRAALEQKRWILDGFTLYWVNRDQAGNSMMNNEKLALRSVYGVDQEIRKENLDKWLMFREKVGVDIASAVAWSGLQTLAHRAGQDPTQKFLQSILSADVPKNAMAIFYERENSWPDLLRKETGIDSDKFFAIWNEELNSSRQRLKRQLNDIFRIKSKFDFTKLSPKTRTVQYKIEILPDPTSPLPYSVLYRLLPPLDEEIDPRTLIREESLYSVLRSGDLPYTFPVGSRFMATVSVYARDLDCEVISGWIRQEVK